MTTDPCLFLVLTLASFPLFFFCYFSFLSFPLTFTNYEACKNSSWKNCSDSCSNVIVPMILSKKPEKPEHSLPLATTSFAAVRDLKTKCNPDQTTRKRSLLFSFSCKTPILLWSGELLGFQGLPDVHEIIKT